MRTATGPPNAPYARAAQRHRKSPTPKDHRKTLGIAGGVEHEVEVAEIAVEVEREVSIGIEIDVLGLDVLGLEVAIATLGPSAAPELAESSPPAPAHAALTARARATEEDTGGDVTALSRASAGRRTARGGGCSVGGRTTSGTGRRRDARAVIVYGSGGEQGGVVGVDDGGGLAVDAGRRQAAARQRVSSGFQVRVTCCCNAV
ncbi:hypothetical protein FB451DRAFT_1175505 [Mycena latifolia]|nr:hypothetical protein FB451DRAFT_1175505 [Mycena latifolia]